MLNLYSKNFDNYNEKVNSYNDNVTITEILFS